MDIPEVKILKALADETRLRILLVLNDRELCVCQVVELLELAPSTVSKHLQILKEARLVSSRKHGRWVYYRSCRPKVDRFPGDALDLVLASASDSKQAAADEHRVEEILRMDPQELCERQRECGVGDLVSHASEVPQA